MFYLPYVFGNSRGRDGGTDIRRISAAAIGGGADPVELMEDAGMKPTPRPAVTSTTSTFGARLSPRAQVEPLPKTGNRAELA